MVVENKDKRWYPKLLPPLPSAASGKGRIRKTTNKGMKIPVKPICMSPAESEIYVYPEN